MPLRKTPALRRCAACGKMKRHQCFERTTDPPGWRRACKACVKNENLWRGKKKQTDRELKAKKYGTTQIPTLKCRTKEDVEVEASLYALKNGLVFTERQWRAFLKAVEEKNLPS